ncbi:DUF1045 domain-containing protein [Geminicoccaceae bacterium 1502E]|nr:DUF1045 domain-containing protein [Geminicoccaceae bacterium 1502E]
MRRYAVYFAPPAGSPLSRFASEWLGRDAYTDTVLPRPAWCGLDPDRAAAITASPRRYGFHATLKAPFAAAEGVSQDDVQGAVAALAATRAPFEVRLKLGVLSGFVALVPAEASPALEALAGDCVRELDHLRAPLCAQEIARRRKSPLSPEEDAHLLRWGYPYVLEQFRFHMTLTERLAEPELGQVKAVLAEQAAALCAEPVRFDALAVFEQPDRQSPFVVTGRHPLGG